MFRSAAHFFRVSRKAEAGFAQLPHQVVSPDTLVQSVGRVDLEGGQFDQLACVPVTMRSLCELVFRTFWFASGVRSFWQDRIAPFVSLLRSFDSPLDLLWTEAPRYNFACS